MKRKILAIASLASASITLTGLLYSAPAKAIDADEYKSSVSKNIIRLNFDVQKVSEYIVKMVNTSDQSLSCKIQAYSLISLLDGLNQSKAAFQDADQRLAQNPKIKKFQEEFTRKVNESSYQSLDKSLRITDSVCK